MPDNRGQQTRAEIRAAIRAKGDAAVNTAFDELLVLVIAPTLVMMGLFAAGLYAAKLFEVL